MNDNELIEVARIGKTIGLQGKLKLHISSDFPLQFKKNATFYTKDRKKLVVSSFNQSTCAISFVGYDDIDLAKTLTNVFIYSTKEETRKNCILEKDEYFWFDIIGCEVIELNLKLGIVEDIQSMPMGNLLYVKTNDNLVEQGKSKFFYIPYNEKFIQEVFIDEKKIVTLNSMDILESS